MVFSNHRVLLLLLNSLILHISVAVFINELRFNNYGWSIADDMATVEIAARPGTNLTGYSIALYVGRNADLKEVMPLEGVVPKRQGRYGVLEFSLKGLHVLTSQAVALLSSSNALLEFHSFGCVLTPTEGPAAGSTSVQILPVGLRRVRAESLQRSGPSSPWCPRRWIYALDASFGKMNDGQYFPNHKDGVLGKEQKTMPFVNEVHYTNINEDDEEAIEIAAPIDTELDNYELHMYDGDTGRVYDVRFLGDVERDQRSQRNRWIFLVVRFETGGLQDGLLGIAVVSEPSTVCEFVSFGGSFMAENGPAAGMYSHDVGVAEYFATPSGLSVQRSGKDSWLIGHNSFGYKNAGQKLPELGNQNEVETTAMPYPSQGATLVVHGHPFVNELMCHLSRNTMKARVELAIPSGRNASHFSLILLVGTNGSLLETYIPINPESFPKGDEDETVPAEWDYVTVELNVGRIRPVGFVVMGDRGHAVDFVSMGGVVTPVNGPAEGETAAQVNGTCRYGEEMNGSLQRVGTGSIAEDFTWIEQSTPSFGDRNDKQTIVVVYAPTPSEIYGEGEYAFDAPWPLAATIPPDMEMLQEMGGNPLLGVPIPSAIVHHKPQMPPMPPFQLDDGKSHVFLNEIQLATPGMAWGQLVEVAVPPGGDVKGYHLCLYSVPWLYWGGVVYRNISLDTGVIDVGRRSQPHISEGGSGEEHTKGVWQFLAVDTGVGHGARRASIALTDEEGHVLHFVSLKRSMKARDGPARGLWSRSAGHRSELLPTGMVQSLQLIGEGRTVRALSWHPSDKASFGEENEGQYMLP